MVGFAPARRVLDVGTCESWQRGQPCLRWKDQIDEALSTIDVINWRKRARSRGTWNDAVGLNPLIVLLKAN